MEILHRENPVPALYWPCKGLQCMINSPGIRPEKTRAIGLMRSHSTDRTLVYFNGLTRLYNISIV